MTPDVDDLAVRLVVAIQAYQDEHGHLSLAEVVQALGRAAATLVHMAESAATRVFDGRPPRLVRIKR